MTTQQIRVVVVDDHPGVRNGIKQLLSAARDILVVGEGGSGVDAIQLVKTYHPDVLLLDVELPVLRGDEIARRLRDTQPEVKILAVSSYDDQLYIQGMLENGAVGYLLKDEAPELLIDAVHSVIQGNALWVSPRVSQSSDLIVLEEQTLTQREIEILHLMRQGMADEEIVLHLAIDPGRLEKYKQLLMHKLGVDSVQALSDRTRYLDLHE